MDRFDVDEIAEVNYPDDPPGTVEIRFRDGSVKSYSTAENPEVLDQLNHWTPPTA